MVQSGIGLLSCADDFFFGFSATVCNFAGLRMWFVGFFVALWPRSVIDGHLLPVAGRPVAAHFRASRPSGLLEGFAAGGPLMRCPWPRLLYSGLASWPLGTRKRGAISAFPFFVFFFFLLCGHGRSNTPRTAFLSGSLGFFSRLCGPAIVSIGPISKETGRGANSRVVGLFLCTAHVFFPRGTFPYLVAVADFLLSSLLWLSIFFSASLFLSLRPLFLLPFSFYFVCRGCIRMHWFDERRVDFCRTVTRLTARAVVVRHPSSGTVTTAPFLLVFFSWRRLRTAFSTASSANSSEKHWAVPADQHAPLRTCGFLPFL